MLGKEGEDEAAKKNHRERVGCVRSCGHTDTSSCSLGLKTGKPKELKRGGVARQPRAVGNAAIQAARMRDVPAAVLEKVLQGIHNDQFNTIVLRNLSQEEKALLVEFFTHQKVEDKPVVTTGGSWAPTFLFLQILPPRREVFVTLGWSS